MENDETLPEEQNPDQQENELELGGTEPNETEPQGGDPLDEIQDADELRKEAKKHRAIAQRHKDKPKPKEEETPEEPKDYLKKSDFELSNQKKAIRLATISSEQDSDEVKASKADMLENWKEVRQFYTPRRGKDTPEDIFEDIKDAYTVFNARREKTEEKPDASELTETKITPTGNPPASKPSTKNPPNFKVSKKPDEWY